MWLRSLLHEFDFLHNKPTKNWINSQGNVPFIKNRVHHKRTKYIDIQHHYVKEMVNANEVSFQYCSMFNMGANALTKFVLAPKHSKCMQILGFMKLDQVEM
jgi:hypothetical protein